MWAGQGTGIRRHPSPTLVIRASSAGETGARGVRRQPSIKLRGEALPALGSFGGGRRARKRAIETRGGSRGLGEARAGRAEARPSEDRRGLAQRISAPALLSNSPSACLRATTHRPLLRHAPTSGNLSFRAVVRHEHLTANKATTSFASSLRRLPRRSSPVLAELTRRFDASRTCALPPSTSASGSATSLVSELRLTHGAGSV